MKYEQNDALNNLGFLCELQYISLLFIFHLFPSFVGFFKKNFGGPGWSLPSLLRIEYFLKNKHFE